MCVRPRHDKHYGYDIEAACDGGCLGSGRLFALMQRLFSLAARSPGLCRWRSGLTCSKQPPAVHRQRAGVCVRPARPFTGEQGRKLCRARFVFAGQERSLFNDDRPRRPGDLPLVAVVGITNPIKWLWCQLFIFFINLHFDLDIGSAEFGRGVKQALVQISNLMSRGHYHRLEGIVSTEMIEHIKQKCSALSDAQRRQLAVTTEEILAALPENVSLSFDLKGKKFCSIVLRFWFLSTPDAPYDPKASIFKVAPCDDGSVERKIATAVIKSENPL